MLFQKSAPWHHAYLRRKVDAWFTGGPSSKATLAFDEEVLVLRFRAPGGGGMVVEGASGTYDVLRWDGKCFTLDSDEITAKRPPEAGAARLKWDRIGANMQAAILQNDDVKRAYDRRAKACKNAPPNDDAASPACETADSVLGLAIANHVRAVGRPPGARDSSRSPARLRAATCRPRSRGTTTTARRCRERTRRPRRRAGRRCWRRTSCTPTG